MSAMYRYSFLRRPAGTPTGGQFAPIARPGAGGLGLSDADDGDHDCAPATSTFDTTAGVLMSGFDIGDTVAQIETVLDESTGDPVERDSWEVGRWVEHLTPLLERAYESVSIEIDAGVIVARFGPVRPTAEASRVNDVMAARYWPPTQLVRRENPDGSPGGLVETTAQVDDGVFVAPEARVLGWAQVLDRAAILGRATVQDHALVCDNAIVGDDAVVGGRSVVLNDARILNAAQVLGHATVCDRARVLDNAIVGGSALVSDDALVYDHARVLDQAEVHDHGQVANRAELHDHAVVADNAIVSGRTVFTGFRFASGDEIF